MNDERKPKQEPIGHATIPPGLRPFLVRTAQAEEHQHRKDPGMDAVLAKINDAIGEDVQEIDPDVGVGNASKYVGPALVPDGATGKAFTAKVKIAESKAKSERPPAPANDAANDVGAREAEDEPTLEQGPPSSRGGMRLGGRTARLMAQAAAEKAAGELAPPVSVPRAGRVSPSGGRARSRTIVVAIAALGVVVAVGVWVVAQGPHAGSNTPAPSVSGAASSTPAAPAMSSSGAAVVVVPTAPPPPSLEVLEADAGAKVATAAAPYKPKGPFVKGEDPYDAAGPLPAKTVDPVVPPPPSTTVSPVVTVTPTAPPPPSDSTAPKSLPYRKKDQ